MDECVIMIVCKEQLPSTLLSGHLSTPFMYHFHYLRPCAVISCVQVYLAYKTFIIGGHEHVPKRPWTHQPLE